MFLSSLAMRMKKKVFLAFLKNKRLPYFLKISASSKLKKVQITNVLVNFLSVRPLSMAQMSNDDERKSIKYGDSSQLNNWIVDSGATCHLTPEVTDFIPGSLEDTDKFIEVTDGNHVTAKQEGSV